MNQRQFEARPEWRATIRRAGQLSFVMEGIGPFRCNYYEYPEGDYPIHQLVPAGRQVQIGKLRAQLEAAEIELVSGWLPFPLL